MKLLIQRALDASVTVDGEITGTIDQGLVIFVCGEPEDQPETVEFLSNKVAKLRIFNDDNGKMNRSILDVGGAALVVSQFTLAADWRRGNRPGFSRAAPPDDGNRLYEAFKESLKAKGVPVASGIFGADMAVRLTNDGPVTIWMSEPEV